MSTVPLPGASGFAGIARRTTVVRGGLAVALVVLVLVAAATVRHPSVRSVPSLPVHSGDMIVLDLSASISSDTFSRIGQTLRELAASGGRYGLVIFSNVAYEALPPGTTASALLPLIRYFTLPAQQSPGAAPAIPTNPWTLSFSYGTRISAGLDLAHRILLADGLSHSRVVLISDLADDPEDVQQLNEVVTAEYGRGRTPLGVVALNATPDDQAFFARVAGTAIAAAPAPATKPTPPSTIPPSRLPVGLVVAIAVSVLLLAIQGLWSARLRWSTTAPGGR